MSGSSREWGTAYELRYIDSLMRGELDFCLGDNTREKVLKRYVKTLEKRKVWGIINKEKVLERAMSYLEHAG